MNSWSFELDRLATEACGQPVRPAPAQRTDPGPMARAADRIRRQAGTPLRRTVSHGRPVGAADWTAVRQPEVVPVDDAVTWYNVPVPGGGVLRT